MDEKEDLKLHNQIATLREVAEEYPGKTIENIIAQMEARRNEIGNSAKKNNKTTSYESNTEQ